MKISVYERRAKRLRGLNAGKTQGCVPTGPAADPRRTPLSNNVFVYTAPTNGLPVCLLVSYSILIGLTGVIDVIGRLGVWLEPINIEFIMLDWEPGENRLLDVQQK